MLIKWITCLVNEQKRQAFSRAQECWKRVGYADGFLGQIGGWNENNPTEAGIISFWRDNQSYLHFMEHLHDEIVNQNNQKNTYEQISIKFYEDNDTHTNITSNLLQAPILLVQEESIEIDKINTILMAAAICCVNQRQNKYFSAVFWESEPLSIDIHWKYRINIKPEWTVNRGRD